MFGQELAESGRSEYLKDIWTVLEREAENVNTGVALTLEMMKMMEVGMKR